MTVNGLYRLEGYPTVWQLTSTVEAELPAHCGLVEQFKALFPCASITGAPKKKNMQWIDQLETGRAGSTLEPSVLSRLKGAVSLMWRSVPQCMIAVNGNCITGSVAVSSGIPIQQTSGGKRGSRPAFYRDWRFFAARDLTVASGSGLSQSGLSPAAPRKECCAVRIDVERWSLRHQLVAAAAGQTSRWWRVRCLVDFLGHMTCQFIPYQHQTQTTALCLALASTAISSDDPWLQHKTDQRQRYEALFDQAQALMTF